MPRVAPETIPFLRCEDFVLTPPEEQIKYETNRALGRIGILFQQYASALNNISLGDNIGLAVTIDFATVYDPSLGATGMAGTELSASHTLNHVPKAIIGQKLDRPGVIYVSQTPSTNQIYIKSDTDCLSGQIYIT
jgi:hypothetical protein